MRKRLTTPLTKDKVKDLKAGDEILLSGTIYTGRDAAHKRLVALIQKGEPLPFDVKDSVIYYVGPTPTPPKQVFGSGGPTTSGRMDAYTPTLLGLGLSGMIGKGYRNKEVIEAMKENHAVYFGAIGGAGAIIGNTVKKAEVIAFEDLGPEAIRRLEVEDLPLVVIIDDEGNNLYTLGREHYLASCQS